MYRIFASLILFGATFLVAPLTASAVTIQWSAVGNAGNANDPATGNLYGGVGYNYNIGTYDVTNIQYAEFLNAKDPNGTSPLQLYNNGMSEPTFGGINYNSGAASGSKYSVISGDGNHPVNYETWYSAIRFANWLNNGQGSGDTESGAYTLLGGTPTPSNGNSITRTPERPYSSPAKTSGTRQPTMTPEPRHKVDHLRTATTGCTGPPAVRPRLSAARPQRLIRQITAGS